MIVNQLISTEYNALKPSDSVQLALIYMEDYGVRNLPLVKDEKLLGYVQYATLENMDPLANLSEVAIDPAFFLNPEHTFFKAIQLFAETENDLLAVCNPEFQGMLWIKDLIKAVGRSTTASNDGAVLLLKCWSKDYSISQLGRFVESEDAKILGLWIWQSASNGQLEIMVKLNIYHIDNLSLLLKTHGYEVLHKVNHQDVDQNEERYLSLLKYLDI